jgi:inorganic pyrophosphatase
MPAGREDHRRADAEADLRYENVHNYTDLPEITLQQIEHFFEHYKDLEPGKWVKIGGWHDAA